MAHPIYRDRVIANINSVMAESQSLSGLSHNGLRGQFRELLVERIFKPLLPDYVDIGTGKIINAWGLESAQIDLVLYGKEFIPPSLFSPRDGLYPIESCYYAIEVKSKLTAAELRDSIHKAKSLRSLYHSPHQGQKPLTPVMTCLVALDSDLTESDELERYRNLDEENATNPAIKVICIVGKGYWYVGPHPTYTNDWTWLYWPHCENRQELLSLLTGIMNSIPLFRATKTANPPQLGFYLMGSTESS